MKVSFCSLGCKVNSYETDCYKHIFSQHGYEIGEFNEICDVYVINTCSVTNIGDRKSRQMIRRAKKLNPQSIVVATGCYAQTKASQLKEMSEVDIIIGTAHRHLIADLVEAKLKGKDIDSVIDIMKEKEYEELECPSQEERTRAYVKIQDGCNNFCSYCIIPYARGSVRSRKIENIIKEVEIFSQRGFLEIVLTGISVASYGKDLENNISLIDVIEKVHENNKIQRIRLSSIDPRAFTDDFIHRISKLSKVCHHFHISLQSGSDSVLKRMNRKYTTSQYMEVLDKLRDKMPDVSITTDIICGFPKETEKEFDETVEFVKHADFLKVHVFPYSERSGTVAARMEQLPLPVREERARKLGVIEKEIGAKFEKTFINKNVKVLFEQYKNGYSEGLSENYMRIYVKTPKGVDGILNVKVTRYENGHLFGELI